MGFYLLLFLAGSIIPRCLPETGTLHRTPEAVSGDSLLNPLRFGSGLGCTKKHACTYQKNMHKQVGGKGSREADVVNNIPITKISIIKKLMLYKYTEPASPKVVWKLLLQMDTLNSGWFSSTHSLSLTLQSDMSQQRWQSSCKENNYAKKQQRKLPQLSLGGNHQQLEKDSEVSLL